MKNYLFSIIVFISALIHAQTNTFPAEGNVGIGTTSPQAKLHVEGQAKFGRNGIITVNWTNENNWGGNSNKWSGYIGFNAYRNNDDIKDFYFGTNRYTSKGVFEGSNYGFRWLYRIHNDADSNGQHKLNEIMRLTSSGNLGIGTTSPQAKLEVSSATSGDAILRIEADEDNNNESDNPMIQLRQDGDIIGVNIGFSELFGENIFGIGCRNTNNGGDKWSTFTINTGSENVGIGTSNPDSKLTVKGKIHAEEVKIDLSVPAPDYVFTKEYELLTLNEVQQHIAEKGHLPNIPSAKELETHGVELGVMNMKLLEKIEELTLYTIAQEEEIKKIKETNKELRSSVIRHRSLEIQNQESRNRKLEIKNQELEARLNKLEALIKQ